MPLASDQPLRRYGAAVFIFLLALGLRFALDDGLPPGFPFITFFPAVIASSFLFGFGPGLLTAVLCGLAAYYFFMIPDGSYLFGYQGWVAAGLYVAIATINIALIRWMQRANARLLAERRRGQDLADHAELLFHELQHRVSNNLQMIGAVLSLQRNAIADPVARQALGDAATKLQTIGRIQRQLYNPDGAHLTLDRFLPELVRDLVNAGGQPGVEHVVVAEPGIQLEPKAAIPVALILAEAVANAVEHGFAEGGTGTICIRVARDAGWLDMTVADDGVGLPDGFNAARSNSLGLRIARTLAEQLGGEFTLEPNKPHGAVTHLRFPICGHAQG